MMQQKERIQASHADGHAKNKTGSQLNRIQELYYFIQTATTLKPSSQNPLVLLATSSPGPNVHV